MKYLFLAFACLLFTNAAAGAQQRLLMPDGTSQGATLKNITSDGNWLFVTGGKERLLASEDFLAWGREVDPQKGPVIVLSDGSLITGKLLRLTADSLAVRSLLWGDVSLPLAEVRGVILQWPARESDRDALLTEIETYTDRKDRVILSTGDRLSGRVHGKAAAADAEGLALEIELGDRRTDLAIGRVTALLPRPPLVTETATPRLWLTTRGGDRLATKETAVAGGTVTISLASGIKLTADGISLAEDLSAIYPEPEGRLQLSQIKPIENGYAFKPFLSTEWPYGLDRAVTGGRLRYDGNVYRRGVSLHSVSRLAFDLPEGVDILVAELALDDTAGDAGSVTYMVFGDKGTGDGPKPLWQSEIIRGSDEAQVLSLDIRDVKRISLVVLYADAGDTLDRANWLGCWLVAREDSIRQPKTR